MAGTNGTIDGATSLSQRLLTLPEAAHYLGCTLWSVRELIWKEIIPENEVRRVRYSDLRAALLQNYVERGNKSLQTTADGSETIWGLKPLDEFFDYKPSKNNEPEKSGVPLTQITTDASREFARMRLDEGVSNDTVNGSLRLLRRMLNIANEDNKIQVVPKIRLLKSSPARKGFLAKEQFDSLVSFLPTFLY
jgi:hypothetical protein